MNRESDGAAIVLVGQFNPAIIQPSWLARWGLIRGDEADTANLEGIVPEASRFAIADWLNVSVSTDRFQLAARDQAHFGPLRDLAVGIFELLAHTPVSAFGVNRAMHYSIESKELWHAIGHALAPKHYWNALLPPVGMRSLQVEGHRKGSPAKSAAMTVEPSARVDPGVYLAYNEHFALDESEGSEVWLELFREHWDSALDFAGDLADSVLEEALREHQADGT